MAGRMYEGRMYEGRIIRLGCANGGLEFMGIQVGVCEEKALRGANPSIPPAGLNSPAARRRCCAYGVLCDGCFDFSLSSSCEASFISAFPWSTNPSFSS
mmetsp:Transcript_1820/g.5521  ORF Transcript_1820/g.5521 Transcript_1820/m.5521 type:complete len:99 (-) Transcript_1820:192-488(-)